MAVKLLHTADIHLGRNFPSLRGRGKEHRLQLLTTFDKIVDLAISEMVNVVLIAGDLFDTNRVHGVVVGRVLKAFERLKEREIAVCILPGTHDPYTAESIYRFLKFPDHVTVFTPELMRKSFESLDLMIHGRALTGAGTGGNPFDGMALDRKFRFHVGMAHCSIKVPGLIERDAMLISEEEIEACGLNYLALGHWHSLKEYSRGKTKAYYSGSPEPVYMDQKGSGNVIIVNLGEDVISKTVPVGERAFDSLKIDVSPIRSVTEIVSRIQNKTDPNLILHVVIEGFATMELDIDSERLETELADKFFSLSIEDKSHPHLEEVPKEFYPQETVLGKYVRIMYDKMEKAEGDDRAILAEALKLGVALLQGRSELLE